MACMGFEIGPLIPSGAKALVDIAGLNVRAEARTLQLKSVRYNISPYPSTRGVFSKLVKPATILPGFCVG
jgi:hypothetical protein